MHRSRLGRTRRQSVRSLGDRVDGDGGGGADHSLLVGDPEAGALEAGGAVEGGDPVLEGDPVHSDFGGDARSVLTWPVITQAAWSCEHCR